MAWSGLEWTGLDWTGLDWTGQDWTGVERSTPLQSTSRRSRAEWIEKSIETAPFFFSIHVLNTGSKPSHIGLIGTLFRKLCSDAFADSSAETGMKFA